MSFLSGLFGGSNPTLNSQLGTLGTIAGTTSSQGLSDVSSASGFFNSILNGGASKTLAPEIGSIQKQGQQQKQNLSQFSNRSGGTNAQAQTIGDKTKASINDMIASLKSSAAGSLGSLGTSLIGQGLGAYQQQAGVSQQQLENWKSSILGQGISGAVSYAESFLPVPK